MSPQSHKYRVSYGYKVSVSIELTEESTKVVTIHSPMYVEKESKFSFSYCSKFTDFEILKDSDFHRILSRMFGPKKEVENV